MKEKIVEILYYILFGLMLIILSPFIILLAVFIIAICILFTPIAAIAYIFGENR